MGRFAWGELVDRCRSLLRKGLIFHSLLSFKSEGDKRARDGQRSTSTERRKRFGLPFAKKTLIFPLT
jgi:hypothetical protein